MASEPAFQPSTRFGAVDVDGCRSLVREKRFAEAQDALKELLEREPDNLEALELMLRVAVMGGKSGSEQVQAGADTIPYLERLVALDPSRVEAHVALARIYRKQRDFPKALEALQAVTELDPGNASVAEKLAGILIRRGEHDKARPIVDAAARHNPDDEKILVLKARLEQQAGETEALEKTLRQIIAKNPRSLGQKVQLLRLLLSQERLDEARAMLSQLPQKATLRPMRYLMAGDIVYHEGRYEDAITDFRAALLNTPGGREVVASLEANPAEHDGEGSAGAADAAGSEADAPTAAQRRADAFRRAARKAMRGSVRRRSDRRNEPEMDLEELDDTLDELLGS